MRRLFLFFTACWAIAGARAQAERCLVRHLAHSVRIDGSLDEWAKDLFVPWGCNAPIEAEASAVTCIQWNDAGLWIVAQTREEPVIQRDANVRRTVELFVDLRPADTNHYDRYERGVYHFTIVQVDKRPNGCRIDFDNSYIGAPDNLAANCDLKAKYHTRGWQVEAFIPWTAIGEYRPHAGAEINGAIEVSLRRPKVPSIWLGTAGSAAQAFELHHNPMTFWTWTLTDGVRADQSTYYRAEETLVQGEPAVDVEVVRPAEAPAGGILSISIPELGIRREVVFRSSLAGHFTFCHERILLSEHLPSGSAVRVELRDESSRWKRTVSVATPVSAAWRSIETALPTADLASDIPRNNLAAFFKMCAQEAAGALEPELDGDRLPQRALRATRQPDSFHCRIDLLVNEARRCLAAPADTWQDLNFVVWRSRIDGRLQPIHISYPLNFDPQKSYPAQLEIPGLVRTRTPEQFIEREVLLAEHGRNHGASGDKFRITLYGRGNSHAQYGREELEFVWNELLPRLNVDRTRVSVFGESGGSDAALQFALLSPAAFSYVHLKAGSPALPTPNDLLYNLRRTPVYLEAGALDAPAVEANRLLLASLRKFDVPTMLYVAPEQGHTYFSYDPPARFLSQQNVRTPIKFKFSTVHPDSDSGYFVRVLAVQRRGSAASVDVDRSAIGRVTIATENAATLAVDFSDFGPLDYPLALVIDGHALETISEKPSGPLVFSAAADGWKRNGTPVSAASGSIGCVTESSFIVVYGTKSPDRTWFLRERAYLIAKALIGSGPGQLGGGHIVIKSDVEVTDADIDGNNLWLIGGLEENSLCGEVPLRFGGATVALGRQMFPIANSLLSYVAPNPRAPNRYLFVEMGESKLAYSGAVLPDRDADITLQAVSPEESKVVYRGFFGADRKTVQD